MEKEETKDAELGAPNEPEQVFNAYKQEFRQAMEKAADALRNAIATAQQTISNQLKESGLDQFQPKTSNAPTLPFQPITGEIVDQAFTWAKQIWEDVERGLAQDQAGVQPLQLTEAFQNPLQAVPADPLAASGFMMSQATDSLNSAMQSIIQAMNDRSSPPGTEE